MSIWLMSSNGFSTATKLRVYSIRLNWRSGILLRAYELELSPGSVALENHCGWALAANESLWFSRFAGLTFRSGRFFRRAFWALRCQHSANQWRRAHGGFTLELRRPDAANERHRGQC